MPRAKSQFWCHMCDNWTDVKEMEDDPEDFWCSVCHEAYHCDECGYDIDRRGFCQRPFRLEDGYLCPETEEYSKKVYGPST